MHVSNHQTTALVKCPSLSGGLVPTQQDQDEIFEYYKQKIDTHLRRTITAYKVSFPAMADVCRHNKIGNQSASPRRHQYISRFQRITFDESLEVARHHQATKTYGTNALRPTMASAAHRCVRTCS